MPITKEKLTTAANELTELARDLRVGSIFAAAKLDGSLAKAAHALGEWHYYKAKESFGRNEEADAGENLQMAATYLQHAADSACFEFGPESKEVITTVYRDGNVTSEKAHLDHNTLATHLQGIERAVKELGDSLTRTT